MKKYLWTLVMLGFGFAQEAAPVVPLTAAEIWKKVVEKYSTCESFECKVISTATQSTNKDFQNDIVGVIRFQKPNGLKLEWSEVMNGNITLKALFNRNSKRYYYWGGAINEYKEENDEMMAQAVSFQSSSIIRNLLRGEKGVGVYPLELISKEDDKFYELTFKRHLNLGIEEIYRVDRQSFDLVGYTQQTSIKGQSIDIKKTMDEMKQKYPAMAKAQEVALAQMNDEQRKAFEEQMAKVDAITKQDSVITTEVHYKKIEWNKKYVENDFDYDLPKEAKLVDQIPSKPIEEYYPILKTMK